MRWNSRTKPASDAASLLPDPAVWAGWQAAALAAREGLLGQADLVSQLIGFVEKKR